jgi:hypothetical protein
MRYCYLRDFQSTSIGIKETSTKLNDSSQEAIHVSKQKARNRRQYLKKKMKKTTQMQQEQQTIESITCNMNSIQEIKDIDIEYFSRQLHQCKGNLRKTQQLIIEICQYYNVLNIPFEQISCNKNVNNNHTFIQNRMANLLRQVSLYESGGKMEIPNVNKSHYEQNDPKREEFVKQSCQFEKDMFNLHFNHCHVCRRRKLNLSVNKKGLCIRCQKEKQGNHKFSNRNKALPTWVDKNGTIRYEIPKELSELQLAEKMLIQQVSPFIPVIHIKNGTLGSRGHVCSFNQDITNICKVFPKLPSEVTMVKVVRSSVTKDNDRIERAFTVNKQRVINALVWLKDHNYLYADIKIDKERFAWMGGEAECNLKDIFVIDSPETEAEDPDR